MALDAVGVTKRYADRVVLSDVALSARPGELVVVSGRSGSGKTTLLSLIAGFARPDEGEIRAGDTAWANMTVVPQTLGLLRELTAIENVAAPLLLTGVARASASATAMRLLGELGVDDVASQFVDEISSGQRQRVALARALVGSPRLLLADEPTSHLDPPLVVRVVDVIRRRLADDGMAAVVITHDAAVIAAADHVVDLALPTRRRP